MFDHTIWDHMVQNSRFSQFLRSSRLEIVLLLLIVITLSFSIITLYSASHGHWALIERQLIHDALGLLILVVMAQIPPHRYYQISPWLYLLTIVLLVTTLYFGHMGKGAQRWLNLFGVTFEPSELAKIAIPLYLARFCHHRPLPLGIADVTLAIVLIALPSLLVMKQPDLGTSLTLLISGGVMLVLAGLSWRLMASTLAGLAMLSPFIWQHMHSYQKQRLLTFLNPERDPLGSGYHIIQSKIAIGSGGLFGKGWISGSQSQLNFLPEHHTDFIFSVIGEELGLIGAVVIITCFLALTWRGVQLSMKADDTFRRLVIGTLALSFGICAIINVAMVSGLLPVVGIPLPLFSYGGTSMLTQLAAFGIIMSLTLHRRLGG